jgi:hypothetical protein
MPASQNAASAVGFIDQVGRFGYGAFHETHGAFAHKGSRLEVASYGGTEPPCFVGQPSHQAHDQAKETRVANAWRELSGTLTAWLKGHVNQLLLWVHLQLAIVDESFESLLLRAVLVWLGKQSDSSVCVFARGFWFVTYALSMAGEEHRMAMTVLKND